MRLSAKVILNYANINNFDYGNQWTIRAGDPNTLYFQIVDLDKVDPATKTPLRYIPAAGATLQVKFGSIDNSNVLVINATQVNASDGSIWSIPILSTQVPAGGNVTMSLTEGSAIRSFSVLNMLGVEYPGNDGSC